MEDFLEDMMKPQMETLFYQYDADILWCDVGGPTIYPELAADWYNWARAQDRQVLANARCGANYSDFDVCVLSFYALQPEPTDERTESGILVYHSSQYVFGLWTYCFRESDQV